ncbi:MAG: HDIG domain-containing protein [Deltaproteobacteria bacterium]|jgi:putative nucleotidyltransferase with HDIG domain|nr:HDIG domain-containing protein [Deltaproteobacteria bacterium]
MLRTRLIAGRTSGLILSAVFASIFTLASQVEVVLEPLRVDPIRPAPVTLRIPSDRLPSETVREHHGLPQPLVVRRGDVVHDPDSQRLVRAFERERRPPEGSTLTGVWIVYFILAYIFLAYLRLFTGGRGGLLRTQSGLLVLIGATCLAAKLLLLLTGISPFILPLATVPLWAALYFNRGTAAATGLVIALVCSSFLDFEMAVVVVYLASTLGVVVFFYDRKHSTHMLVAGTAAGLFAALALISIELSSGNALDVIGDVAGLHESMLLSTIAGGMISGVLAVLLQRVATAALGVVTRGKLQELTDVDHPLLRKMSRDAPGSWQHARAMANLAEGAAAAIGADSLLTRVGAYYHDLGKTIQPKYYIENLAAGEPSPHGDLEPDVSADAIMAHVVEGVRILREGGIPEPVVEFAYTHHGTSVIEYFWHKCLEAGNPKGLSDNAFRYPGMRPRTRETAILMLIDAIEAAARSVEEPTREKFEGVVQRVTNVKLRQGQLDESGLSIEDLRVLQSTLIDTLCNAYHNRIKYPWQDEKGEGQPALPVPGVATERDVARERSREST